MIQETEPRKPEETRKAAACLFLSLDGRAEQPDEFVTDVDDATEASLRGVSR
jgi:hypothetical protein